MRQAIHADDPQKRDIKVRKHVSLRVNLLFFVTFALFCTLIVRLAVLQFVEGPKFRVTQSKYRDVTLSPIRGNIYDLNNFPIAYTVSSLSVFYRMEPGRKNEDYIEIAGRLERIFGDFGDAKGKLAADEILKRMDVGIDLNGKKTKELGYMFMPRRIKTNLTKNEIAYISEHRDELSGIEITEESTRVYNRVDEKDSIAAQLVGYLRAYSTAMNQKDSYLNFYKENTEQYVKDEYVGYDGLEFQYQEDLRGKNGKKTYPVNSRDQIIGHFQISPPEKGHSLYLTINKDVQLVAQEAIQKHLNYMRSNEARILQFPAMGKNAVAGYAVAMEVNTGRVVAMANYPDYDPNMWTGGISPVDYNVITNRYTNGTILDRYPEVSQKEQGKHPSSLVYLGSTMKPLTILVGLMEGMITPQSHYSDSGTFYYGKDGSSISNSDHVGYGDLIPYSAIWHSSNTFMSAMVGNAMYLSPKYKGQDALTVWDNYMTQFGLGVTTGSGLPNESEGKKDYFASAKKDSMQAALVFSSFGQKGKYTALQLAQYTSMLANKGKRYKPQFVDKIVSYDGKELIKQFEPEILNEVKFPDNYWKVVKDGMALVSAQRFQDTTYTHVQKTGTSQQDVPGGIVENAVFIAYAPADNPKLAVAVVVPEGGYGSWGAAPIAREIFDAYDKYVGGLTPKR